MSKKNRQMRIGFIMGLVVVFILVMIYALFQYVASEGLQNAFQFLPGSSGITITLADFDNIMLFLTLFVLSIAVLALLTHGAIIKAAKKFIPAYVLLVVVLFFATGIGGAMVALIVSLSSLMVLWQFALRNVMFRAPVSGPEEIIGSEGTVVDPVTDEEDSGRVKVGDSLWWAVSDDGSIIDKGEKICVEDASSKNLVLKVRRLPLGKARAPTRRRCPNCGASVQADATFCTRCGTALS
jgi:membrane protein implicated in regulation of membrane protease activity